LSTKAGLPSILSRWRSWESAASAAKAAPLLISGSTSDGGISRLVRYIVLHLAAGNIATLLKERTAQSSIVDFDAHAEATDDLVESKSA